MAVCWQVQQHHTTVTDGLSSPERNGAPPDPASAMAFAGSDSFRTGLYTCSGWSEKNKPPPPTLSLKKGFVTFSSVEASTMTEEAVNSETVPADMAEPLTSRLVMSRMVQPWKTALLFLWITSSGGLVLLALKVSSVLPACIGSAHEQTHRPQPRTQSAGDWSLPALEATSTGWRGGALGCGGVAAAQCGGDARMWTAAEVRVQVH